MNSIPLRFAFTGKQIGEFYFRDELEGLIEKIESGEIVFAPAFMKYPDGRLKLLEISLIPRERSLYNKNGK